MSLVHGRTLSGSLGLLRSMEFFFWVLGLRSGGVCGCSIDVILVQAMAIPGPGSGGRSGAVGCRVPEVGGESVSCLASCSCSCFSVLDLVVDVAEFAIKISIASVGGQKSRIGEWEALAELMWDGIPVIVFHHDCADLFLGQVGVWRDFWIVCAGWRWTGQR